MVGEGDDPGRPPPGLGDGIDHPRVVPGDIDADDRRGRRDRRDPTGDGDRIAVEQVHPGAQRSEIADELRRHTARGVTRDDHDLLGRRQSIGRFVDDGVVEAVEGPPQVLGVERPERRPLPAVETDPGGGRDRGHHLLAGGCLQVGETVIPEFGDAAHDRRHADTGLLGDLGDRVEGDGPGASDEDLGDAALGGGQAGSPGGDAVDESDVVAGDRSSVAAFGGVTAPGDRSGRVWNTRRHSRYTIGMRVPTASSAIPTVDHGVVPVVDVSEASWEGFSVAGIADEIDAIDAIDEVAVMDRARRLTRRLPDGIAEAVLEFADHPPASGAVVIRPLPVGDLPPTPPAPGHRAPGWMASEVVLLTVARLLGQPIGYAPEHGGRIVQDIVPVAATADQQISTSSSCDLMFHTETAFHPYRPRYLLLSCLRGDEHAATTLMSIHGILAHLDERSIEIMRQPRFRLAVDASFLDGRPNRLGEPLAILTGTLAEPTFVFDADLMSGIDPEAQAVVEAISSVIADHHSGVVLEAGDLLIVDNQLAVHGRTRYQPRYDGTDRWLQRSFVVPDLAPSAADRRGRMVVTAFGG